MKITKQLRIKAGCIEMGEKIAWGSDTDLMYQAADEIDRLNKVIKAMKKNQVITIKGVSND